jgi:ligand-binding SRPBCC domain-containing protein
MATIHELTSIQKIPASLEATWQFFSNPQNLKLLTPPALDMVVTNKVFGDEVYAGQIMSYKLKPLLNITAYWTTEITHVDKGRNFVDEQRKGPYRLWHHQHHFKEIEHGIEMTDLVHYRLPLGFLGNMTHGILVKKKLIEIFTYRFNRINEIFGSWPGQTMQLQID